MEISDRINKLCKERGITRKQMETEAGLSNGIASKWKKAGFQPGYSSLMKLSEYFGVSVDYLLGFESAEGNTEKKIAVRIPVFGRVPAGIPLEAIEDIVDYEEIPAAMLNGGRVYFGIIVRGDSMYPKYIDGDIVIVRKQETFESGQDCIVYVNGYEEATLKTVHMLPDGGVRLQPINTSYMPKTYYPDDEPIFIAGIVVQIRRNV